MKEKEGKKDNLAIYEVVRVVPDTAKKTIAAGRLKGMTDINPIWRIKILTEMFGPCGFGWRYEIAKQWLETAGAEIKAFCNINLYICMDGKWSEPIPGTGGSSFMTMERNGPYVSDECHKMALTDAISVAAKALGVGADVYFSKDMAYGTKYETAGVKPTQQSTPTQPLSQEVQNAIEDAIAQIKLCVTTQQLKELWNSLPGLQPYPQFVHAISTRKNELKTMGA